ncbi:hypothetical protein FNYG_14176 [Fusarium nygamai]|uniref:SET domain-containing protein n=1 Tax=Gibberella nygamai TaxID=42673 RepID=A0A2K0UTJ3_GIBNY|nr:hypothetical protein FNYG_14176 [Fusarium nygamai]
MDLVDGSFDQTLVKWVKTTEAALAEAQTKKGQLVTDHPAKDAVNQLFAIRALGKAIITPGLSPAGGFVRMACGSDYPFPNSKLVEDHLMALPITTVEAPYPPCTIPEKDLKPISISEMRLETHHWGSKVLLHQYSEALDVAETPQDKQLAHLNRSLTNLKLGRPAEALLDATQAYDPEAPTEKALFRHATALYKLNRFEDCEAMLIDLLDKFPDSKAAETTLLSVKTRLTEQHTGKYNFKKMYETAKAAKGAPLIDCATYSKPVEIRESPGRGRGLFTTKAVKAGDLLLVEKAFEYSFIDETRVMDQCTHMVNFNTKRLTAGASANLWPKVVQKLYHDPEALSAFTELHHGKYKPVTATEADGRPVVDAFLVEKILSLNSFGAPRSTRDFCGNNVWSGNPAPEVCASTRERPLFTSVGVWLLAARINHSCVGNCRRSFIGDMAIIRAARDIPADTELTIPYRPSTDSESYQDVQKGLAKWGFKCDCELCKDRLKTTEAVRVQRKELSKEFNKQLPSDQEFDLDKATKLLRVVEKTYSGKPAKQIRWCIADLYAYVGIRCR